MKLGPKAKRAMERDLRGAVEQKLEQEIREKFRPQKQNNVRQAGATMRRQEWK